MVHGTPPEQYQVMTLSPNLHISWVGESTNNPPLGETAFWAAGHLQLPTHKQRQTETHAHWNTQVKSFTSGHPYKR